MIPAEEVLLGVAAHKRLPDGQDLGVTFWHCGQKYYVTQAELDRIKNLPSVDEIRGMVAKLEAILRPTA